MIKEVHFFTEMGYSAYDQEAAGRYGYTSLLFPNEYFSPEKAQELYSMYFEELQYCTEAGYDGVMINEHHNNPLNMMPSVNVIGSILAKTTKKGKIVFLGNVLPIHENPLRIAEEIAMIDIISGGTRGLRVRAGHRPRIDVQQRQPSEQPGEIRGGP